MQFFKFFLGREIASLPNARRVGAQYQTNIGLGCRSSRGICVCVCVCVCVCLFV